DITALGHLEGDAVRRHLDDAVDFRYHIAAALEQHPIVDLQAQPADLVFVVKGGVPDRGSAKLYGLQLGYRRERARAADLYADIQEPRCGLPSGKFHRDGPSWRF